MWVSKILNCRDYRYLLWQRKLRSLFQETDHVYICILRLTKSLYIFYGLLYHQRTFRDLENNPCSFSIINVRAARESYSFYAQSACNRTSKPMRNNWKEILCKHWLLVHAALKTKIWRFHLEHVTSGLPFYILY